MGPNGCSCVRGAAEPSVACDGVGLTTVTRAPAPTAAGTSAPPVLLHAALGGAGPVAEPQQRTSQHAARRQQRRSCTGRLSRRCTESSTTCRSCAPCGCSASSCSDSELGFRIGEESCCAFTTSHGGGKGHDGACSRASLFSFISAARSDSDGNTCATKALGFRGLIAPRHRAHHRQRGRPFVCSCARGGLRFWLRDCCFVLDFPCRDDDEALAAGRLSRPVRRQRARRAGVTTTLLGRRGTHRASAATHHQP